MKLNERNAGRKKVLNGVKVNLTVPQDKVLELKNFAKTLIKYDPPKLIQCHECDQLTEKINTSYCSNCFK